MSRKTTDPTVVTGVAKPKRTEQRRGLLPGNRELSQRRGPPLQMRVASAAGAVLGEPLGELIRNVLAAVHRRTIPVTVGKLLIERLLPPGKPIRLGLPHIRSANDLIGAQEMVAAALNAGIIVPTEAQSLQAFVQQAWNARREANREAATNEQSRSPEEVRAAVEAAARGYGMIYPNEKD